MGKAAKKRLDAKKRLLFETCGDARSPEERAQARAMLDALQQKLEDDALREDGFYFLDGEYAAVRRPRTTSGMKMRSYDGHARSVKAVALVRCKSQQNGGEQSLEEEDLSSFVFTFGLDRIGIWDFKTTELIASLDVSSHDARFICGAAVLVVVPVCKAQSVRFAYATHSAPVLHMFDPKSKTISAPSNQHHQDSGSTRSSNPRCKPTGYFCGAHQQQITSMTFSHNARVLATCSWDSTCMLWRIQEDQAVPPDSSAATSSMLRLVLVRILPIHELSASFACFTLDDQQLITTGECTVKLWDVSGETSEATDQNPHDGQKQVGNWGQFEKARVDWEAAIPFSLSVKRSMDLLAFDEALTELVPNHEWQHRSRDYGCVLKLLTPEQDPLSRTDPIKEEPRASTESSSGSVEESQISYPAVELTQDDPVENSESPTQVLPDPSNQEGLGDHDHHLLNSNDGTLKSESSVRNGSSGEGETLVLKLEGFDNILSFEDAAYLDKYYRDLASFDFEQLLNPTLPFRITCESTDTTTTITSDKESQSEIEVSSASESKTPTTNLHELIWNPLQSDANGKLLNTFSKYNAQSIFSAHTSTITCCAVSKELDIVVTVALDKMLKFWLLETGQVLETVRDAHYSQITCCALTIEKTLQNSDRILVATGGKDNLVKVWRRNYSRNNNSGAPVQLQTECIYSFSGHYDAITSCVFDATGVFLITTGDDTNVITWRVVPSSPDQPKALRFVSVEKFVITVSWDEPLANGSPLLHYVIRTTQVSSLVVGGYDLITVPDVNVPAEYTSKVIENLQPGIQYTLQIAAVNAIGSSPFSDLMSPIETLAFVPSRIENPLQYSDRQATQLRLSWKQPSPNGALIQSFTIRCLPENSVFVPVLELSIPIAELETIASLASGSGDDKVNAKKKKTTTTSAKQRSAAAKKPATCSSNNLGTVATTGPPADVFYSYMVDGFWAGEIYQFVAAAENRCGLGGFSRVSDYVKMDPTAPDPPSQPQIMSIQKRQVDVAWEKPKCNGSEILQYTLEWVQDDGVGQDQCAITENQEVHEAEPSLARNSVVLLTRSIPGTSYTLQNLEPGKPLRVWLSASNLIDNKICTSEFSPASDIVVTLCDVPDKPARPELVQPSAHTLVLAFTPPRCNGLEIQSYDVMIYVEEVQFGITNRHVYREFKLQAADCNEQLIGSNGLCVRTTFTTPKLRGKTCYSVKLCAINALGASLMSECSELVSTKSPTVPARMLEPPVVLDIEPTRASISWGTPEHDGGAPLVAFHLQYSAQPTSSIVDNDPENGYKALFDQEVTIFQGQELLATFLKPKTSYRFRVASSNAVGKAPFSKKSVAVHSPSLVEFTISRYFADRPEAEHVKARFIQKRYRAWKLAATRRKSDVEALRIALRGWHIL